MKAVQSGNSRNSRGQLRQLTVLIAVATIDMIGGAMVFPLMPFYALKLDASPAIIGMILASFFVAQLISAPVWGRVSDRYGRRPALLVGLTASSIGFIIFGFADSVWLLFLSRIIQGAGGGTTGVLQAYVSDTIPVDDRARSLGWLSAGTNLGTMLGPVIGSFASHWGQEAPGVLASLLCMANAFFAWKWLPESKTHSDAAEARRPVWHGVWSVIRHPQGSVERLTIIYAVSMFAFSAMSSVLALYMGATFGVTEATIGYVFLYIGIFSVVMRSAFIGPIVDRIGETWSMRLGAASLMLGLLGYAVAPTVWVLGAIIPLVPIGTALLFPATTALMSKAARKTEFGLTMGAAQTFAGVSRVIAPVLSTNLFQRVGHASPFYFAAMVVALVSLLAWQGGPKANAEPVRVVD